MCDVHVSVAWLVGRGRAASKDSRGVWSQGYEGIGGRISIHHHKGNTKHTRMHSCKSPMSLLSGLKYLAGDKPHRRGALVRAVCAAVVPPVRVPLASWRRSCPRPDKPHPRWGMPRGLPTRDPHLRLGDGTESPVEAPFGENLRLSRHQRLVGATSSMLRPLASPSQGPLDSVSPPFSLDSPPLASIGLH